MQNEASGVRTFIFGCEALSRWQSYLDTHSTYEVVGVVIGPYYNANGSRPPSSLPERYAMSGTDQAPAANRRETATLREAKARMAAARESEEAAKAQRLVASLGGATCNARWIDG
eukprot:2157661-Rhodomonas_salina.1